MQMITAARLQDHGRRSLHATQETGRRSVVVALMLISKRLL